MLTQLEVGGWRAEEVSVFRVQCSGKKRSEVGGQRSEISKGKKQDKGSGFRVPKRFQCSVFREEKVGDRRTEVRRSFQLPET